MLTTRFDQALVVASNLHREQSRKGTNIPYVSHLLAVAGLVLENDGDEDEAIAALLHDAIEDAGGRSTEELIRTQFGDRVTGIVLECTDTDVTPKPPWRARKEAYLAHLPLASTSGLLVSCCDKLHNARCIVADLRVEGDKVWSKFNGGRAGTLWYYDEILSIFKRLVLPRRLVDELSHCVSLMHSLVELEQRG